MSKNKTGKIFKKSNVPRLGQLELGAQVNRNIIIIHNPNYRQIIEKY